MNILFLQEVLYLNSWNTFKNNLKSTPSSIKINQKLQRKLLLGVESELGLESLEGDIPHIFVQLGETFNSSKRAGESAIELRDDKAQIICCCSNSRFLQ